MLIFPFGLAIIITLLLSRAIDAAPPTFDAHYFNQDDYDTTESIDYGACFPFLKPGLHLQYMYFPIAVICQNYHDETCQTPSSIRPRFQSAGTHIPVGTSGSLMCRVARNE